MNNDFISTANRRQCRARSSYAAFIVTGKTDAINAIKEPSMLFDTSSSYQSLYQ